MEEKKEMSTEEIKMDNDPKGEGKEKASSPLREVLSWVVTLLAAFALAMVLKNYVIINATVPTGSMEHTIEPGDDLFGLRLAYQFSEPKRGDIVIFRFPDDGELMLQTNQVAQPLHCQRRKEKIPELSGAIQHC